MVFQVEKKYIHCDWLMYIKYRWNDGSHQKIIVHGIFLMCAENVLAHQKHHSFIHQLLCVEQEYNIVVVLQPWGVKVAFLYLSQLLCCNPFEPSNLL